jgi:DNA repair protein RadD
VLACQARECSECNTPIVAISTVREAEGELVELGSRKSGGKTPLDQKEQFYAELKWIQSLKGHNPGWCWHKYRERFKGERPPKWFEILAPREPSISTRNWLKSRVIAFAKRRA